MAIEARYPQAFCFVCHVAISFPSILFILLSHLLFHLRVATHTHTHTEAEAILSNLALFAAWFQSQLAIKFHVGTQREEEPRRGVERAWQSCATPATDKNNAAGSPKQKLCKVLQRGQGTWSICFAKFIEKYALTGNMSKWQLNNRLTVGQRSTAKDMRKLFAQSPNPSPLSLACLEPKENMAALSRKAKKNVG